LESSRELHMPGSAVDRFDLHGNVLLAMAHPAMETLPAGEPFDPDFGVFDLAQNLGGDGRAGNQRLADLHALVAGNQEDFVESDGGLTFGQVAEVDFE